MLLVSSCSCLFPIYWSHVLIWFDLIWRWIQNFTTSQEINKPYEFNWTKNKCLSCICHTETCDSKLSFHESEQTAVPEVNVISSDFLCMNFLMWIFCFVFPEIFVRQKCLAFFFSFFLCVCTCTNLLVLNTEVKKNVTYMNSIAMGQINQCWFQSYVVLINNVYLWK